MSPVPLIALLAVLAVPATGHAQTSAAAAAPAPDHAQDRVVSHATTVVSTRVASFVRLDARARDGIDARPWDGLRREQPGAFARAVAPAPGAAARLAARPSRRRAVGWGALAGALAGTASALVVREACDSYCDGTEAAGFALHVGTGALLGAGVGWLVHRARD